MALLLCERQQNWLRVVTVVFRTNRPICYYFHVFFYVVTFFFQKSNPKSRDFFRFFCRFSYVSSNCATNCVADSPLLTTVGTVTSHTDGGRHPAEVALIVVIILLILVIAAAAVAFWCCLWVHSCIWRISISLFSFKPSNSFTPTNCHMDTVGTAIKRSVPDRVKPSFVIFDIRALWGEAHHSCKLFL